MECKKLDVEYLRQKFRYDPITGHIYDRHCERAESKMNTGYLRIPYKDGRVLAHRAAYAMHTGIQPKYVDHKNRVKNDNKFKNLRGCTKRENGFNMSNQSKHGACIGSSRTGNSFRVRIQMGGRLLGLGSYKTPEEAQQSRNEFLEDFAPHFGVLNDA